MRIAGLVVGVPCNGNACFRAPETMPARCTSCVSFARKCFVRRRGFTNNVYGWPSYRSRLAN